MNERAVLRCALSKELEQSGQYELARDTLGELWQGAGARPRLDGLNARTKAEVLLRAGCLSSSIGSTRRAGGEQETAKDLISESVTLFESLGETGKAAEAEVELAWCYWREGAYGEARALLRHAARLLGDDGGPVKAVALLRSAIVELEANQVRDAVSILAEAAPLFEASDRPALKGSFHNTRAVAFERLGGFHGAEEQLDRALVEYAAASYYFDQAGHTRYRARVENNLGELFYLIGRFAEAREHLHCARRLFSDLGDNCSVAQVDDTRARALLAAGEYGAAEEAARTAVRTLAGSDQRALQAEALITHGVALARSGRTEQAQHALMGAIRVAEEVGASESEGGAALALIEEVGDCLPAAQVRALYRQADEAFAKSENPEHLRRLRLCARRALAISDTPEKPARRSLTYVSEKLSSVLRHTRRLAAAGAPVLIVGEAGTGKEDLARLIHEWGGRSGRFAALNCAALDDEGSATAPEGGGTAWSAAQDSWAAHAASGGTLFLDEVGNLSLKNQAALLRLLEEASPGQTHLARDSSLRVIAATSRDLEHESGAGRFRADLLARLSAGRCEIPPLRARAEDIPGLARALIEEAGKGQSKVVTFTAAAVEAMRQLPLFGNFTELRDLIERTFESAPDGAEIAPSAIEAVALRQTRKGGFAEPWANCSLEEETGLYEGRLIRLALNAAQGRITRAARLLGVTHQSLAFIINSRHKELLGQRKPARQRRSSIIRPALKKALEKERRLARTDDLTGVANKRAFFERLAAEIQRPGRHKRLFTVAFLDVDDFKQINDQRGHGVGDSLLKAIAESIRASLRSADVVARLGGDEFAILLPETGRESAAVVLQIVQENLQAAVRGLGVPATLSIGAVACPNAKCTAEEIVGLADQQMYAVKSGRKGSIKIVTLEESPAPPIQ